MDRARRHLSAGDFNLTIEACHEALEANPQDAEALYLLGLAAFQRGDGESAVEHLARAVELDSSKSEYLNHLGSAYGSLERFDDALGCFEQTLVLDPESAQAHFNIGNVRRLCDQQEAAATAFQRAIELQPEYHEAHFNLGNVRLRQEKLPEAIASYEQALKVKPDYEKAQKQLLRPLREYAEQLLSQGATADAARTYGRLGVAFQALGKRDKAIAAYRYSLQLKDDVPEILVNLGVTLKYHGEIEESMRYFRRALELWPDCVEAHANLGRAYCALGDHDAGQACYERALEHNPDHANTHFSRACALLQTGDFSRGWDEYEWRWQQSGKSGEFPLPPWKGEDIQGKRLLVRAEQGLGDNIQFIRYLPLLEQRCASVVVECQPVLVKLLQDCGGVTQVVPRGEDVPPCDLYVNLLSVPRLLETIVETIPGDVPYLKPVDSLATHWSDVLGRIEGFKVGVAWQAKPTHDSRSDVTRARSFSLEKLAGLAELPHVRLINLQQKDGLDQLAEVRGSFEVIEFGSEVDTESGPFMDTAAIMKSLDLVICCDSAVGHLAGALGVPTWLALPFWPDWRWLCDRDDNPWYPAHRLFRQQSPGDWDSVFARMRSELANSPDQ